jgi:hypothetical protein
MDQIPVFIINLKRRTDRKEHIIQEFSCRNEFRPVIVEAMEHPNGAIGLWTTIRQILLDEENAGLEYIILCEDDHHFTDQYSIELLLNCIQEAEKKDADVLCGGVSGFRNAIAISESIFWVEMFSGMQFTILFRRFFNTILGADFNEEDAADTRISLLTSNKFFIYPFISVQKEFGYSDVTPKNNVKGRVETLFSTSMIKARSIKYICNHYDIYNKGKKKEGTSALFNDVTIPTYVICDLRRADSVADIQRMFKDKCEFSVSICNVHEDGGSDMALMQCIRQIIAGAVKNDEDIIIICREDHEFTEDYSKEFLLKNILEAYSQGADILSGGVGEFDIAVPVSQNRFWINILFSMQFLVLYRSIFQKIIESVFDDTTPASRVISSVTSSKMTLLPFISVQRKEDHRSRFVNAAGRLQLVQKICFKLLPDPNAV